MNSYVESSSEIARLVKRYLYSYLEDKVNGARAKREEPPRIYITDDLVQETIAVIQSRLRGNADAKLPLIPGKISQAQQTFVDDFFAAFGTDFFLKTSVKLPYELQKPYLAMVVSLLDSPGDMRKELVNAVRDILPKLEGCGKANSFKRAVEKDDKAAIAKYIDFGLVTENVQGVESVAPPAP